MNAPTASLGYADRLGRQDLLRVCFLRFLTAKTNPEYRYFVFSHVYLYLPNHGLIWETTRPRGTTGFSQDKYHDAAAVEIVLDVKTTEARGVLEGLRHYGSCAVGASAALQAMGVIPGRHRTPDGLFFELCDLVGRPTSDIDFREQILDAVPS